MAEHASDYRRGEMDIHEQSNTFHAFLVFTKWSSLVTAVGLLVLTLWFATDTGFFGGLIAGALLLVLGIYLLRERKSGH